MPTTIQRDEVQRLLAAGAQLVEVLPAKVYAEVHLPGAINIPLTTLDQKTTASLQHDYPIIVYCYDQQ